MIGAVAAPAAGLRRILVNAGWLLLAYVLPRVFTFGAIVIAARVLGTRDFGAYGTAAAYAVILSIMATLGMMPLLIRDIAREPARAPRLLGAAHLVKTGTNAVMLITLWLLATRVFHYSPLIVTASLLLGVAYAIGAYAENFAAYFQAVERMQVWMQASALFGLLSGALGTIRVLATRSVAWFCVATIIGQLAALTWLLYRAPAPARLALRVDAADVRRLLRALVPFAAAFVALTIYYKADVLLLAGRRAAEDVGEYTAAYKFIDIVQALAIVAASAVYPRLARAASADKRTDWAGTRVTELMMLATVPAGGIAWLIRVPLIHFVYGTAYRDSASVFAFLAPAIPSLTLCILAGYVLGAKGRMGLVAALYAAGTALKVALNLALVPAFGAVGTALAMLLSETALAAGLLFAMRHAAAASPARHVIFTALGAVALCALASLLPDPTGGLIAAPLYIAAVGLLYWKAGVLPERDVAALRESLRRTSSADAPIAFEAAQS
jgi:O-antigen/teichoic acid export membrane protein